jgi:hypothetical protein
MFSDRYYPEFDKLLIQIWNQIMEELCLFFISFNDASYYLEYSMFSGVFFCCASSFVYKNL